MAIELSKPELTELHPRISVMGVGGAGGNAVNNMIRSDLQGVSFIVANTDAQSLALSSAGTRIQLGIASTQGLGAGSRPEIGRQAAEEALDEISQILDGCHMLFLTAGMGGGTGTGATPVIARAARERGILTVGVVTKPFRFEGARRMALAEAGIRELQEQVDTLIVIPNQNLFRIATEKTTFHDAFAMADEVLNSGVRGITDLMVMPGLINLDFADVRTVMSEMGKAMMGTGEAAGERRAIEAAEAAISNPLLDEVSLKGARGVIINITGGMDLTLFEVDEAANHIRSQVDDDANIIVGSAFNESLDGQMRVSVVATGIETDGAAREPVPVRDSGSVVSIASINRQPVRQAEATRAADTAPAVACESKDEAPAAASGEVLSEIAAEAFEMPAAEAATAEETAEIEDAFIAPEPVMPRHAAPGAPQRADAFADAALDNAGPRDTRPAGAGQERGVSLFRRVAALGRRGTEDKGEASDKASHLGRIGPEDRPVPRGQNAEQLEIPAFLRRQVN